MAIPRPPHFHKTRSRGLRTKTGCLTCRRRHLKCDEVKPACRLCKRGNKTCMYPKDDAHDANSADSQVEFAEAQTSPKLSLDHLNSSRPEHQEQRDEPTEIVQRTLLNNNHGNIPNQTPLSTQADGGLHQLGDQGNGTWNQTSLHASTDRHSQGSNNLAESTMSVQPLQPPDTFGVSPDAGTEISYGSLIDVATARWFGMLANDAEMGTVDLQEQSGFQSQPNALERILDNAESWRQDADQPSRPSFDGGIDWEMRRNVDVDQQGHGTSDLNTAMWKSPHTLTLQDKEQHLFEIFVNRISHWLDLFDPFRHFCTLVPRLAMYNEGLLMAILAFSVRYLSLNPEHAHDDHPERHDALRYYHESLHYLQNAMQYNSYLTSLELLATAVIISGYEMLDGSRKDWERHLQGVFGIQRSQIIHGDTGGLRGAVWWTWLQQDIWAAFREKRKTFTFWRPARTFDMLNPWEIAARSLFVMAKVVNYCSRIENCGEENNVQSRTDAADRLTSILDDWERYLSTEFVPLPLKVSDDATVFEPRWIQPPIFGVAMQIYYAARILLALHRPSLGGLTGFMKRQKQLDRYVEAIGGIAVTLTDYASSVASSQCLFIAGMCTFDERKRKEIVRLIDKCRARTGWPVKPMDEELKAIWDSSEPI